MPPTAISLVIILAAAWLVFALICRKLLDNPRGDPLAGLGWYFARVYARVYHQLRVRGRENVPRAVPVDGRPVIVIGNHTAGLDPILIQSQLPFFVRWLMAEDMRGTRWEDLWKFVEVIMVKRWGASEVAGMREAMRHLKEGGAIGIFPEGRLHVTRGQMHPFLAGIGVLIARSNALVLPCVIAGTPHCSSSWASLFWPSRSRLDIKPLIDFRAEGIKAGDIASNLQARYERWTREI